jgi:hypothetical protein
MQVKDLIEKLGKADPEHEVFVAPLIFIPVMQLNTDDGALLDGELQKVTSPFERYAVANVGLITDLERNEERNHFIVLGYDTNEQPEVSTNNEFIN